MPWYVFAREYVNKVVDQHHVIIPQDEVDTPLEEQINKDKIPTNARGVQAPGIGEMLNFKPDLMKAQGVGGEYNWKSHQNQFPEGGDNNFINPTEWNSN